MRNFFVNTDKLKSGYDFYIVVSYNDRYFPLNVESMRRLFNMGYEEINNIIDIYGGMAKSELYSYENKFNTIRFKTENESQKFIDDVLIPYEIAFNLNGGIQNGIR